MTLSSLPAESLLAKAKGKTTKNERNTKNFFMINLNIGVNRSATRIDRGQVRYRIGRLFDYVSPIV
jgi:hypothetical protein